MEELVDVNKARSNGWTPLHIASKEGRIAVMICLVHYAARLDAATNDGRLPIDGLRVGGDDS